MRHVPNISERIKKEAIKAPSSWLPVCWLTAAPTAAGGELCSAARPRWGHGAPPCHPPANPALSHSPTSSRHTFTYDRWDDEQDAGDSTRRSSRSSPSASEAESRAAETPA